MEEQDAHAVASPVTRPLEEVPVLKSRSSSAATPRGHSRDGLSDL